MCEMGVKSQNAIVTFVEQIRPKPRLLTKQYSFLIDIQTMPI